MTLLDQPEQFIAESAEVYYAPSGLAVAGPRTIAWLIARAASLPRHRARVCLHASPEAPVHDMIIVHGREAYVRPHRHAAHGETLTVLEGEATAVTFDELGTVRDRVAMGPLGGPAGGGRSCFYRMPAGIFHALVIESEWLVFHETAAGPFDRSNTEFPSWAPDASDAGEAAVYLRDLRRRLGEPGKANKFGDQQH
jgi:cupin fold WbuC family metalloprotein